MRAIFESGAFGKRACRMLVAVVAVMIGLSGDRIDVSPAVAQAPLSAVGTGATLASGASVGGGGLISHFYEDPNGGPTRVILVDPLQKRMLVYHVPLESGAIQLKSVRNFTIDLQVQAYNSDDPSTIDMEKTLQRN